ncbi:unnamed protein product, partial [Ectocarpus fasciculatus]
VDGGGARGDEASARAGRQDPRRGGADGGQLPQGAGHRGLQAVGGQGQLGGGHREGGGQGRPFQ